VGTLLVTAAVEAFVTKHAESPRPLEPTPIIPGAYERDAVMWHQPGEIGGKFNGEQTPSPDQSALMDESVREEHRREGGGGRIR
jgi:hypothetical protein